MDPKQKCRLPTRSYPPTSTSRLPQTNKLSNKKGKGETDYCLRAQRAGWKIAYVVESSVTHIGSVSTGFKDHSRPTPRFWFASRRHYFLKNHGRLALWAANLVYFLGGLICRIRYGVIGRPTKDPRRHLRDFAAFNFRLRTPSDGRPPRKPPAVPSRG